jgi:PAS domain S-box-containing protein
MNSENLQLSDLVGSRRNENIFEELAYHFPDIVHSVNAEGQIVSTNKKAEDLLGYSRDELLGMNVLDIYDDSVRNFIKDGLAELKDKGIFTVESKLKTKSGKVIDVEIRSLSLYDANGHFVKTFSIIRDVREIKRLKQQVVQANKLAAIGELAAGIIHDIRNPLTVIDGYNSLIMGDARSNNVSAIEKSVNAIKIGSAKIQKLTEHLRQFSRLDEEKKDTVVIRNVIADALFMLEMAIKEKKVKVEIQVTPHATLFAHYNQIEQVFINMLGNACDALQDIPTERTIVISSYETPENSCVTIKDNGSGIPKEKLEFIFESFFTTKEKGKGTGLGLAICAGIVKEHGGKIDVKSTEGLGTEFTISIRKPS